MARGGFREGSGRKKGSKTLRTSEIAIQAAGEGLSPLEIMLRVMRHHWEMATKNPGKFDPEEGSKARDVAKDAAPYVHPRLNSIEGGDPSKPISVDGGANLLEAARRLAFTITMGAREAAKQRAVPEKTPIERKKAVRA